MFEDNNERKAMKNCRSMFEDNNERKAKKKCRSKFADNNEFLLIRNLSILLSG